MMRRLRAIAAFWYDFVVGDDWRLALGVGVALAATYGISRSAPAWWLLPVAVLLLLFVSLRRAVRAR